MTAHRPMCRRCSLVVDEVDDRGLCDDCAAIQDEWVRRQMERLERKEER